MDFWRRFIGGVVATLFTQQAYHFVTRDYRLTLEQKVKESDQLSELVTRAWFRTIEMLQNTTKVSQSRITTLQNVVAAAQTEKLLMGNIILNTTCPAIPLNQRLNASYEFSVPVMTTDLIIIDGPPSLWQIWATPMLTFVKQLWRNNPSFVVCALFLAIQFLSDRVFTVWPERAVFRRRIAQLEDGSGLVAANQAHHDAMQNLTAAYGRNLRTAQEIYHQRLQQANDAHEQALHNGQNRYSQQTQELDIAKNAIDQANATINDLKKKLGDQAKSHTEQENKKITELQTAIQKGDKEINKLVEENLKRLEKKQDDALTQEQHKEYKWLANQANMRGKTIEDHEKTIQDHEKTIQDHEKTIQDHEKTIQDHEKTIQDHENTIKDHEKIVQDHKKTVQDHEKTIQTREKTIQDHEKTIQDHENIIKDHEKIVQDHKKIIQDHEKTIQDDKRTIEGLNSNAQASLESLEAQQKESTDAHLRIEQMSSELQSLKTENSEYRATNDRFRRKTETEDAKIKSLDERSKSQQEKYDNIKRELDEQTRKLKERDDEITKDKKNLQDQQVTIRKLRRSLEDQEAKTKVINDLRKKNDDLNTQLKAQEDELSVYIDASRQQAQQITELQNTNREYLHSKSSLENQLNAERRGSTDKARALKENSAKIQQQDQEINALQGELEEARVRAGNDVAAEAARANDQVNEAEKRSRELIEEKNKQLSDERKASAYLRERLRRRESEPISPSTSAPSEVLASAGAGPMDVDDVQPRPQTTAEKSSAQDDAMSDVVEEVESESENDEMDLDDNSSKNREDSSEGENSEDDSDSDSENGEVYSDSDSENREVDYPQEGGSDVDMDADSDSETGHTEADSDHDDPEDDQTVIPTSRVVNNASSNPGPGPLEPAHEEDQVVNAVIPAPVPILSNIDPSLTASPSYRHVPSSDNNTKPEIVASGSLTVTTTTEAETLKTPMLNPPSTVNPTNPSSTASSFARYKPINIRALSGPASRRGSTLSSPLSDLDTFIIPEMPSSDEYGTPMPYLCSQRENVPSFFKGNSKNPVSAYNRLRIIEYNEKRLEAEQYDDAENFYNLKWSPEPLPNGTFKQTLVVEERRTKNRTTEPDHIFTFEEWLKLIEVNQVNTAAATAEPESEPESEESSPEIKPISQRPKLPPISLPAPHEPPDNLRRAALRNETNKRLTVSKNKTDRLRSFLRQQLLDNLDVPDFPPTKAVQEETPVRSPTQCKGPMLSPSYPPPKPAGTNYSAPKTPLTAVRHPIPSPESSFGKPYQPWTPAASTSPTLKKSITSPTPESSAGITTNPQGSPAKPTPPKIFTKVPAPSPVPLDLFDVKVDPNGEFTFITKDENAPAGASHVSFTAAPTTQSAASPSPSTSGADSKFGYGPGSQVRASAPSTRASNLPIPGKKGPASGARNARRGSKDPAGKGRRP